MKLKIRFGSSAMMEKLRNALRSRSILSSVAFRRRDNVITILVPTVMSETQMVEQLERLLGFKVNYSVVNENDMSLT